LMLVTMTRKKHKLILMGDLRHADLSLRREDADPGDFSRSPRRERQWNVFAHGCQSHESPLAVRLRTPSRSDLSSTAMR
jgi:hypothetical protein